MKRVCLILLMLLAAFGLMAQTPEAEKHELVWPYNKSESGRLMLGVMLGDGLAAENFSYAELLAHIQPSTNIGVDTEMHLAPDFKPQFVEFSASVGLGDILKIADYVDPTLLFGWSDVAAIDHTNSGYVYEDMVAFTPASSPRVMVDTVFFKLVHLMVNMDPVSLSGNAPDLIIDAYGDIGPFGFSVDWWSNSDPGWKGKLGFDAAYRYKIGPVSGSVDAETVYDLQRDTLRYGLGIVGNYKAFTADWSFYATRENGFGAHGFGFYYALTPIVNFALGLQMVANGQYVIDSAEPSLLLVFEKARLRFGYLWDPAGTGQGAFYAPGTLPEGFFFKFDLSF